MKDAPVKPTDKPGGPIKGCNHRNLHRHGTYNGYQGCGCKCPACSAANTAYCRWYTHQRLGDRVAPRPAARKKATDPTDYVPAREKTPFGQFELKKSHLKTSKPGAQLDAVSGFQVMNNPIATPDEALTAAATVLHHCPDNEDARDLLDVLGLTEILRRNR